MLLAALAFGEKITPSDIFVEGIRRITPLDFEYARQLKHTIRLVCGARKTPEGLILFVRPALIPSSTILASVQGPYNAVWVKGQFGEDTFYYGWGAGHPTGVAVVSDLMRVAREIRSGSPERVSPFAHERLGEYQPVSVTRQKRAYYLRFRVEDRPGIIATLAGILAAKNISLEAVLQEPCSTKHDLPFVITVEETSEQSIRDAVDGNVAARFHARGAAGASDGDCAYENGRNVCAALVLAAGLSAQVATNANSGYQTEQQRKGLAQESGESGARQYAEAGQAGARTWASQPGMTVADVGTGIGYMLPFLSRAVGPEGKVIAEDIFDDFLEGARQRSRAGQAHQRDVRQGHRDGSESAGRPDGRGAGARCLSSLRLSGQDARGHLQGAEAHGQAGDRRILQARRRRCRTGGP